MDKVYIHPQGIAPDGLWIRADVAENLVARDVLAHCEDCEERYPDEPTYMITGGGDDEEEDKNLNIVLRYEVK